MNSNPNVDLEDVITDAVNDSYSNTDTASETPEYETSADSPMRIPEDDHTSESEPEPVVEATEEPSESPDIAVASPGARQQTAAEAAPKTQDDFERLAGVPQLGIGGRENRIPYSRVKKITEKAVSEVAEAVLGRKLAQGEKAVDVVKAHVAQLPELQTKVSDYETRLDRVGEFESVMANEPERFLPMLAKIPAYREFFELVEWAYNARQATQQPAGATQQPQAGGNLPQPSATAGDGMPEPDEELSDGSRVYSMDGLKQLLAWNAQQVESRVTKQVEDRYRPIESEWKERRRLEATLPVIRAQIAEAQTWPLFNENEAAITAALEANKNISLEAAYRQVVFPKLVAERNSMRQNILQEVRNAPVATSVPRVPATRPAAPNNGPRSMEDIIREAVATLK